MKQTFNEICNDNFSRKNFMKFCAPYLPRCFHVAALTPITTTL